LEQNLRRGLSFNQSGQRGTPTQSLWNDIRPLNLTPQRQKDLVALMEGLTAKSRRKYQPRSQRRSDPDDD
jgi:hypothetical protein